MGLCILLSAWTFEALVTIIQIQYGCCAGYKDEVAEETCFTCLNYALAKHSCKALRMAEFLSPLSIQPVFQIRSPNISTGYISLAFTPITLKVQFNT